MPYVRDEQISTPPADAKLWRYMSFGKFASILEKNQLFFPRATDLGDRFEGTQAQPLLDYWRGLAEQMGVDDVDRLYKVFRDRPAALRPYHFISCWSENPYESAALWTYYTYGSETVAIQTTFGRLCESLKDEPKRVEIGRVRYIDFKREAAGNPNSDSALYFAKRNSFSFEHEVRAMVVDIPQDEKGWGAMYDPDPDSAGHFMRTNLPTLIEAVYVAPDSPVWLEELVRSTLASRGLTAPVHRSSLADGPLL